MDVNVFKEPKGFIKFLEIIMAILAFATVSGFSQTIQFNYQCNMTIMNSIPINYPFAIDSYKFVISLCNETEKTTSLDGNYVSQSQFFVFVGVFTLLYSIFSCIFYLFYHENMLSNNKLILTEFVISCVLTFFWLVGSSVWAGTVGEIKYYTSREHIFQHLKVCQVTNSCRMIQEGVYGILSASIVAGFTCFLLWASNIWFLRRDTPCLRHRYSVEVEPILPQS